jgi:hypothetical protein
LRGFSTYRLRTCLRCFIWTSIQKGHDIVGRRREQQRSWRRPLRRPPHTSSVRALMPGFIGLGGPSPCGVGIGLALLLPMPLGRFGPEPPCGPSDGLFALPPGVAIGRAGNPASAGGSGRPGIRTGVPRPKVRGPDGVQTDRRRAWGGMPGREGGATGRRGVEGSDDGGRSNPGDGSASGGRVIDFFARLRWSHGQ